MFGRKRKLFVKDTDPTLRKGRFLPRTRTFKQSEFSRFDIPGEVGRSLRKLAYFAVGLAVFWFFCECFKAWDIFQ